MNPETSTSLKVSICVISYNHEAYITNCLQSLLSQQTNFEVEIVIGEDCSTDNTRQIIEKFSEQEPSIRLLPTESNMGALPNFVRTLKACKGEYIAFCEGDDYWIDEQKLQKQFDFLEREQKYGGVSTNNKWYFESDGSFRESVLEEAEISFEELSKANNINSQSILFRRSLMSNIDWIADLKIGDWPLHLLISNSLPYFRLSDIATVYRVHEGGIHSLSKEEDKIRNKIDVLKACLNSLDLSQSRKELLKTSIKVHLRSLLKYKVEDTKEVRRQYFEFGGELLDKTLLKSYWNEIF